MCVSFLHHLIITGFCSFFLASLTNSDVVCRLLQSPQSTAGNLPSVLLILPKPNLTHWCWTVRFSCEIAVVVVWKHMLGSVWLNASTRFLV